MDRRLHSWAWIVALLAAWTAPAGAAAQETVSDLTPPELTAAFANFGDAVALSADGGTALVGAARQACPPEVQGTDCGAAWVFVRGAAGWVEQARLVAPDPTGSGWFGSRVALSADGSVAAVRALAAATCDGRFFNCPAVYVFRRTGGSWSFEQQMVGPDPSRFGFGNAVALSGDGALLLIGEPILDLQEPEVPGHVYVYPHGAGGWSAQGELVAEVDDPVLLSGFGARLALSPAGDRAVVTSGYPCPTATCSRVYGFDRDGGSWIFRGELLPASGPVVPGYGLDLALIADGTALVGSPEADCPGVPRCGEVFVFGRSGAGWSERDRLVNPEPAEVGRFGNALALSADGRSILAGSIRIGCAAGDFCGAAFLLTDQGGGWTPRRRFVSPRPQADAHFGASVDLSGDARTALVGEPSQSCQSGPGRCGAAYAIEIGALSALEVPTAGEAALALLALGLAAAGTFLLRRA